jgi:hypothetical protein
MRSPKHLETHPASLSFPRVMPRLGTLLNPPSSTHEVISSPSNFSRDQYCRK